LRNKHDYTQLPRINEIKDQLSHFNHSEQEVEYPEIHEGNLKNLPPHQPTKEL